AAREGHLRRRTPEPAPWASSVRSVGNGHFGHSRRPGEARTPGRQLSPLETCAGPDPATPPVRRTTRRGAMLLRKIIGPVGTFGLAAVRSEERRVGNEGRAGGSRGVQMGQVQSGEERE